MATLCKNFIYMHPEKVVTKSACMSWAIKEEIAPSRFSSSSDPQDVSAQHLLKYRGNISMCTRLLPNLLICKVTLEFFPKSAFAGLIFKAEKDFLFFLNLTFIKVKNSKTTLNIKWGCSKCYFIQSFTMEKSNSLLKSHKTCKYWKI